MRNKWLFLLPLAAIGAIVAVVFVYVTANRANAVKNVYVDKSLVDKCGTCHSMKQQVSTWQESPHKNVACLECHTEADANAVRLELQERHVDLPANSASAEQPHTVHLGVTNEQCLKCHTPQMDNLLKDQSPAPVKPADGANVTVGKPLSVRAEHDLHLNKAGVKCIDCHTSAVHGAKPGTTESRDATHSLCLDCHTKQKVTMSVEGSTSCSACHTDPKAVAPADHKDAAQWQSNHGKAAAKDNNCNQCHLGPTAGLPTAMTNPQVFTSKVADACQACHAGVGMPHTVSFISQHGAIAQSSAGNTCQACHPTDSSATGVAARGSAPSCASCHSQPMPHPANYLTVHGQNAVAAPAACQQCHSSQNKVNPTAQHASDSFCTACHAQPMPHSSTYLSVHGQKAVASSTLNCQQCHSSRNPVNPTAQHAANDFCTACHAQTMPHPANYLSIHGSQALAASAACQTCHSAKNQANPTAKHAANDFCTSCHAQPMPHPANYVSLHGSQALAAPATCQACHSSKNPANPGASYASDDFCTSCHDSYSHPTDWVAQHGSQVTDTCAACHTTLGQQGTKNACATCHTGSSYNSGNWHPDMWFATHGDDVASQGKESCLKCHASVGPSCSQCHKSM